MGTAPPSARIAWSLCMYGVGNHLTPPRLCQRYGKAVLMGCLQLKKVGRSYSGQSEPSGALRGGSKHRNL